MNGTVTFYTPVQLAMLPLASLVVCPTLSVLVYYLARRRLTFETPLKSRARLFYLMLSGNLLGYTLSHIINVSAALSAVYVAVGYVVLWILEEAGRGWNSDNIHYIGTADGAAPEDIGLDRKSMELNTVYVSNDVTDTTRFAREVTHVVAQTRDLRKRYWMLGVLFVLLLVISFVDGLFLIYRAPSSEADAARLIVCYYVNAISLSICIYGAMIHAKMHVTEHKPTRMIKWFTLSGLWCVLLFVGSVVMTLANVQWSWTAYVIRQPALVVLYGIACGTCLRMQAYFFVMKQDDPGHTERKDIALGVVVYIVALAQSIGTSLYI